MILALRVKSKAMISCFRSTKFFFLFRVALLNRRLCKIKTTVMGIG